MQQHHVLEHHHKRKVLLGDKPFVNTKVTRFVDAIIYPVGFFGIIVTLPQVYDVWVLKQVVGVSLITFSAWALIQIVWIIYGYIHRHHLILTIHTAWFVLHLSIALGILVHS